MKTFFYIKSNRIEESITLFVFSSVFESVPKDDHVVFVGFHIRLHIVLRHQLRGLVDFQMVIAYQFAQAHLQWLDELFILRIGC